MAILRKAVAILKTKKEIILGNRLVEHNTNVRKVSANWDKMVNLLDTIVNSELSDLQRLKKIDVGRIPGRNRR